MHSFEPLLLLDVRQTATTGLPEFAQACSTRMHLGDRLVTLFGRPDASGDVVLSAVLQPVSGELCVLRSRALSTASYPSLTTEHPAAQMFERELWEQTGITPVNHPWLKPVRYEGALQQTMAQHSFFKVRGPEVHEVGVGPIHAGVIEPGHFRFMCLGEQVHHLELQLGYQHRGLEPLLLRRSPLALAATVESICGDSCIANAWAYCASVEAMAEIPATTESNLTRAVALELERVAMHLATLAGLATDIAILQGGASYGRLRTAIINATMRVCGSRFGRGWVRPGGVRFGLTDTLRADLTQTLTAFSMDIATVDGTQLLPFLDRPRGIGYGCQ